MGIGISSSVGRNDHPRVSKRPDGRIGRARGDHHGLILFQPEGAVNRRRSVLLTLGTERRDGVGGGGGEVGEPPGAAAESVTAAVNSAAAYANAELSAMLRVGNGSLLRAARRTLFPLLPGLIDDENPDERSADDAADDGDDDNAGRRHRIEETNARVIVLNIVVVVVSGPIRDAGMRRSGWIDIDAVISGNDAAGSAAHERQGRVGVDDAGRVLCFARVNAFVG